MTTDVLLYQMRARLTDVDRQIARGRQESAGDDPQRALYATAYLAALASERRWLADVIGQIEREGVAP